MFPSCSSVRPPVRHVRVKITGRALVIAPQVDTATTDWHRGAQVHGAHQTYTYKLRRIFASGNIVTILESRPI